MPPFPDGFRMQKVFTDPTPHGLVNHRIMLQSLQIARTSTDLTGEEFGEFVETLMAVSRKLCFTWIHKERYLGAQAKLREDREDTELPQGHMRLEVSEELFQEFDEFMVQLKSTLDHLVKVGRPILGAKRWTLGTFGDKGKDVLKALERNGGKAIQDRVRYMRETVFKHHADWLETFIAMRDRLNHAIGAPVPILSFGVNKLPDGTIVVPMWSEDQELGETLEIIWGNLFMFVEAFIAQFLFFRSKQDLALLHVPQPLPSIKPAWTITPRWLMEQQVAKHGWKAWDGVESEQAK